MSRILLVDPEPSPRLNLEAKTIGLRQINVVRVSLYLPALASAPEASVPLCDPSSQ